ncbi:MAG: tetratricopeptide repeat protein, partial [Pseudanabaena sp.]
LSMAIITYREIIKNNPEDALAHFNMGKILAQQKRNQEAVMSFQRAEELYTRLGDLKAINEVQAAIKDLK